MKKAADFRPPLCVIQFWLLRTGSRRFQMEGENSVNMPAASLERSGVMRMCVIHKNIPAMLASITTLLSKDGVNVENLSNKSKGDYAYTMVDLGTRVDESVIEDVRKLANVIRVRVIE